MKDEITFKACTVTITLRSPDSDNDCSIKTMCLQKSRRARSQVTEGFLWRAVIFATTWWLFRERKSPNGSLIFPFSFQFMLRSIIFTNTGTEITRLRVWNRQYLHMTPLQIYMTIVRFPASFGSCCPSTLLFLDAFFIFVLWDKFVFNESGVKHSCTIK